MTGSSRSARTLWGLRGSQLGLVALVSGIPPPTLPRNMPEPPGRQERKLLEAEAGSGGTGSWSSSLGQEERQSGQISSLAPSTYSLSPFIVVVKYT